MSNKPSLSIAFSNNNLLKDIQNIDGVAAMIGTAQQVGNQGKVIIVHNLDEAVAAGISLSDEPFAYRHIKEFYAELGGNQELYLMFLANTVTMAQMLDVTDNTKAMKLIQAGAGKIAYLGVWKTPAIGYSSGAGYLDTDVAAAVTASKGLALAQNSKLNFLRILIEGRINDETSTTIYAPNTASNGFAGVVIGGTKADKSASVGLMLGRKVKYAAHIKIGKVLNGALSATEIYIGTKKMSEQGTIAAPVVNEVRATSTITITGAGATAGTDTIYGYVKELDGTWTYIGQYIKDANDDTVTKVALAYKTIINAGTATHGYTATNAAGVITLTDKAGRGAATNGLALYTYSFGITHTKTVWAGGVTASGGGTATMIDTLYDKGYISFVTYPNKAGFYFGIDNMATDDDFRILAHGAVIDAAAKVVTAVYLEQLESEVDTNDDGTIKEEDAAYLEAKIEQQVGVTLGERISGFEAVVDRSINIINTSKVAVKMRVLPKGYTTYITVDLGLTSGQ